MTSRSASRSFLLPQRMTTMLGLARVRASVSQLVRALYVSLLKDGSTGGGGGVGASERPDQRPQPLPGISHHKSFP